jgi:hypothetical protein
MGRLRHAFAVDPPGGREPNDEQRAVVDRICAEIVRRRLATPALIFLEMFRPLNYIGAQAMHFFQPIVTAVARGDDYRHFTEFLEGRGSVDYMCRRIEEIEAGRAAKGRAAENREPSDQRECDESEDERDRS